MTLLRNLMLGLIVVACATAGAVDPALLSLVPADATVISGIQVEQSKASPFGQYVLSQMAFDDPGMAKFITETGFDPRRDLSEIVVATTGTSTATQFVVLGRGVFNPARIVTAAQAAGALVTSYNGLQLVSHKDSDNAVAFLDASTAAMGTTAAVKAAIDRRTNPSKLDAATLNKVRDLAAANDAWFLSTVSPGDFFSGKMGDPGMSKAMGGGALFQAVKSANGGVKFTASSVQISGEALTRSDQDATALADVLRFIAGLVQNNKETNPQAQQAATLLQSLQVSTQASTLKLTLTLPEDLVEKLFMPHARKGPAAQHRKTASLR